ncbi:MAG: GFA family protein, partial [Mesorhizobium sp.]
LGMYTFGNHVIAHRFCRTCGVHPFAEDVSEGSERSAYVNINCLDDIDLGAVPVIDFDGRSA